MALTLSEPNANPTVVTLATTRNILRYGDARAATGQWLVIAWAAADQSASNIVSVELGQSADGAVGSHPIDVHPGSAYERWVFVGQAETIGVAGSSAFDVALRLVG